MDAGKILVHKPVQSTHRMDNPPTAQGRKPLDTNLVKEKSTLKPIGTVCEKPK